MRLRLLSTAVWRTRAVQRLDGAEVRAAPVGGGQWVLTADGLDTVYRRPGGRAGVTRDRPVRGRVRARGVRLTRR